MALTDTIKLVGIEKILKLVGNLAYYGTVTTYTNATHFKSSDLTGLGDEWFEDWYVYVVRDAGGLGAAPQGEHALISDYTSSDGTFTHAALTVDLADGDEVMIIHPWLKDAAGGDATAANQTTIINALYAAAGIASYPAAAAPGDGVSLAEVLRQVYDDVSTIINHQAEVSDVIIYPVAEHAATTEIADDGTSPAFYADTETGTATLENAPNVHWSEDIDFEQNGTINVISIFAELRWQHKTSGGTAYSKVQMSRDSGANWVDMTDSIAETNVAYQDKTRIGVGRFVTTIVAGVDQLEFRLVSWEAGGATSSAKIRSDSYIRITHRKS